MNYFNYFTEIEETFIRRRGKHLLLSPLDWALIESWQERGIPLRIVLRGIENVFDSVDKKTNRVQTIKSLTYCREEIETQYAEWLEANVGKSTKTKQVEPEKPSPKKEKAIKPLQKSTLFSDETIADHLENVSALIEKAKANTDGTLKKVLEKISAKISEQKNKKQDAEKLEETLNRLENLIDQTLLEIADKKSLKRMKAEVEKELAKYKSKMEADVYRRTFELMLLKKLREKAEIPRISLFYL